MSAAGRVGVGVIGAGVISDQYLSNLTVFPDVEVLFIADIDLPRAASQAEKWGVAGSGTVEELLAIDDIEIVVNLTIPAAHVEVALQALRAGKHVCPTRSTGRARRSCATPRSRPAAPCRSHRTRSWGRASRPRSARSATAASGSR
jgi:predicted homoserine dehydrogenase-like protein